MSNAADINFRQPASNHRAAFALLFATAVLILAAPAVATPSQSDVFKSIQDNVRNTNDGGAINPIPWVCGAAGLVIVLALLSKRQSRQNLPKVVNNGGRLIKEIMRVVPLRPRELKQLKTLAEELTTVDDETVHPLVLVLCPSIVVTAVNEKTTRADRRTLVQMLKRMGFR